MLKVLPRVICENYLALLCSLWEMRIIRELPNMAIPIQRRKTWEPLSDCILTSSGPSSAIRKPRPKPHATALSTFLSLPKQREGKEPFPSPTAHSALWRISDACLLCLLLEHSCSPETLPSPKDRPSVNVCGCWNCQLPRAHIEYF